MNNNPIGFFDSGVGLISVLKETKKLLPLENFVIFADQGHNPYGEKSKVQIRKYAKDAISYLIKKHQIKMMVLACNTATVLALDFLRKHFEIPIVGTVPAVKTAYGHSKKSKIAVMSTPATAKSQYLKTLIKDHGRNAKTLKVGCFGLEEAIEILDKKRISSLSKKYTIPINKFGADVVVLGCTHYPLVKDQIRKNLTDKIKIIDSGQAIAKRVKSLLADNVSQKRAKDFYYTSGDSQLFSRVASTLLRSKIRAYQV